MVRIQTDDGNILTVDWPSGILSGRQRAVRAGRFLGGGLLAAVVAVFIPVLHFILVPLLIVVAVVGAWFELKKISYIQLSSQCCPKCKTPFGKTFLYQTKQQPLSHLNCENCRSNFWLSLES